MGILCLNGRSISFGRYTNRKVLLEGFFVSVTTTREVFCGVISQGVAPYFFMKICSFFGHRTIENDGALYSKLYDSIMKAIELGCRIFYFGGFGEFDSLCYEIVSKIKNEANEFEITRTFCVPQERDLRRKSRLFNPESYENVIYLSPSFDGWYKSIYFRNCAMIDKSDVVIFYAENRENSGAYKAYKYAKGKDKTLFNLYE